VGRVILPVDLDPTELRFLIRFLLARGEKVAILQRDGILRLPERSEIIDSTHTSTPMGAASTQAAEALRSAPSAPGASVPVPSSAAAATCTAAAATGKDSAPGSAAAAAAAAPNKAATPTCAVPTCGETEKKAFTPGQWKALKQGNAATCRIHVHTPAPLGGSV
jgi:hypothetical protein